MVEIILWYVITFGICGYIWTKWKDADNRAEKYRKLFVESADSNKRMIEEWRQHEKKHEALHRDTMSLYTRCYDRMHYYEKLYHESQGRLPGDEWKDLQEPG